MRYIIDRATKGHERYDGQNYDATKYRIVEADSEGWIPHTGTECPLPDGVWCDIKTISGGSACGIAACWIWNDPDIKFYRPILILEPEKAQEPEPIPAQLTTNTFDLLGTLKRAHQSAQQIPDLEAELREVLGSMGYTFGKLGPFVEPEAAVEPSQDNKYAAEW